MQKHTLTTFRTRKGALNYITRSSLGYEPGQWYEEDVWTGQKVEVFVVKWDVEQTGEKEFAVVRYSERGGRD